MKLAVTQALILGLILTALPLYAQTRGGSDGGGGGGSGIICLNQKGKLTKPAKLTDLEEAPYHDKWHLNKYTADRPWKQQLETAVNLIGLLDPQFNKLLRYEVQRVVDMIPDALNETKGTQKVFPAPQDVGASRLPPMDIGCMLVGFATFLDRDIENRPRLSLSWFAWNSMPEMHKAGLVLHEAVYRIQRLPGRVAPRTSESVRRLVGMAFSIEYQYFAPVIMRYAREKFQQPADYHEYGLPWESPVGSPLPLDYEIQLRISDVIEFFLPDEGQPIYYAGAVPEAKRGVQVLKKEDFARDFLTDFKLK